MGESERIVYILLPPNSKNIGARDHMRYNC